MLLIHLNLIDHVINRVATFGICRRKSYFLNLITELALHLVEHFAIEVIRLTWIYIQFVNLGPRLVEASPTVTIERVRLTIKCK